MERAAFPHKRSPALYRSSASRAEVNGEDRLMMGLALVMFIGLFAFGHQLLGWTDHNGQIQLGLFMSFIFGIICGYRTRR